MKKFFQCLFGLKHKEGQSRKRRDDLLKAACCSEQVHIAYRGVSDDRLYLCLDRRWSDLKYFRPNGLRVFCAICRRRIYFEAAI
jgi:hypothetical protein